MRVLTWEQIADMVRPVQSPDLVGDDRRRAPAGESRQEGFVGSTAPARSRDQLLHVIGRHPCMTVEQLARLLGAPVDRVKRLEHELIQEGLLRRIEFGEVPRGGTALTYEDFSMLGLVEITSTGRRRLAGWLGLELAAASRYHGLAGNSRQDAGRRRRLLRTLRTR